MVFIGMSLEREFNYVGPALRRVRGGADISGNAGDGFPVDDRADPAHGHLIEWHLRRVSLPVHNLRRGDGRRWI